MNLTATIAAERSRIARDAVAGAPPAAQTIIADLIVDEFLDRIGAAADGAPTRELALWLDAAYDRHGDVEDLGGIFDRAYGAVERAAGIPLQTALSAALAAAAARPRGVAAPPAGDAIDDVDVIINDLVTRLFAKDAITAEHSRAVASWCARIARKMGLSAEETLLVQRGGLLHDVGKIATPDEILNAPRGLTPDERAIIQRHPLDGLDIIAGIPELEPFAPAIRDHHERIDGSGYPHRLRGDRIALPARLVSVADCFNAMVGRRPYRPPLSPYVAIRELSKQAGRQYDGDVVEAMVAVVLAGGEPD